MGKRILNGIKIVLHNFFNLKIRLKYVLFVVLIFAGASVAITYSRIINDVGGVENYDFAKKYIEARDVIEQRYIDESDDRVLGDAAIAAMVKGLNDGYSYYMSPTEYENYKLSSSDEYGDIGMSLLKTEKGGFQVVTITAGSAAQMSGLYVGAVINAIDNEDITQLTVDEARMLLRQKMNVIFDVKLDNGETVTIDCESTHVSSIEYVMEKTEAGYIKISNFEAGTGQEFISAVEDLLYQGAIALCIDVRNNPGGLMNELKDALDYLLPAADLFSKVDRFGTEEVYTSDTICVDMPITVLVNGGTYGAAEYFAAALQENNWATVIGEPSTGNVRVQETAELSDGSAIRLSTATYLTGKGTDLYSQGGVIPDTIVYNQSETSDEQKDAALKLMSIG